MKIIFLCLLLILNVFGSLINERTVRVIDLTGQVEKQIVKHEILNDGSNRETTYYFPIPNAKRVKLAFFKAVDEEGNELQVTEVDSIDLDEEAASEFFYLSIQFYSPLHSDSLVQLTITLVFTHVLQLIPAEITQKENQYVIYEGNRFADSVYFTQRQHTKLNVASETIKSYTKDGHETLTGKKIKYGTYEDVPAFTVKSLMVHFRNNNPFLTMTEVVRDMEISMWGNVRVSEGYNIRHDGAKLVGAYESNDYSASMMGGRLEEPSAVRSLKATLPAGASRVTYTDRIGNISTSHFRSGRRKSTLEIEMRYKLLGGWKTDFLITYDVPASEFISYDTDDSTLYYFNASFGIPFSKPVANHVKTQVALPQGAYDIKVQLPFEVDEQDMDVRFTYLDSTLFGGRPVVYFVKSQVVREHFEYFQISFRYSAFRVYYKIGMVMAGFGAFLLFFAVINRLDLSLGESVGSVDAEWIHSLAATKRLDYASDPSNIVAVFQEFSEDLQDSDVRSDLKSEAKSLAKMMKRKFDKNKFDADSTISSIMDFTKKVEGKMKAQ